MRHTVHMCLAMSELHIPFAFGLAWPNLTTSARRFQKPASQNFMIDDTEWMISQVRQTRTFFSRPFFSFPWCTPVAEAKCEPSLLLHKEQFPR